MMVGLDEALRRILALPRPEPAAESVALGAGAGRVLAEPATARWPLPLFTCSAVDGWALRAADLPPGEAPRLPIRGRIVAGEDAADRSVAGGVIRIFTGAMMPPDADTVVMQEQASTVDGMVRLPATLRAGQNVRQCGEQAQPGAVLLLAGRRLRVHDLALAAAGGLTAFSVVPSLRVGVLSTGDEVRPVGAAREPAAIPDQNGAMLAAALAQLGATAVPFPLVGDDRAALADRLRAMAEACDAVITTGGVSVGEEDHLRATIAMLGDVLFERIAVKPGRPAALGRIGSTPVLALPGNPAAAFTAFHLLGDPLVRHLSGEVPLPRRTGMALAGFAHAKPAGLCEAIPVTLAVRDGGVWAERAGAARGGLLALSRADALALVAQDCTAVAVGDALMLVPLAP